MAGPGRLGPNGVEVKVKDLVFNRIEGDAPLMTCNTCGSEQNALGWRMADIPIGGSGDTISIVVCSKACKRAFKAHPMAQKYVDDLIRKVEAMRAK